MNNPDRWDEIATFQIGRYISSGEAAWRIFAFEIHDHYPPVQPLAVHLPDGQNMAFDPQNLQAEQLMEPPGTTLTAFFELCATDETARDLLYADVPWRFRYHKKAWQIRKLQPNLGRIYNVLPSNRELFFVRLLLLHVRGPTSFLDLRTVNGQVCETFQQACELLGLLESDSHWRDALEEAALKRNAKHIRDLFAIMLADCEIGAPNQLWERFREDMCADYLHQVSTLRCASLDTANIIT